jgi:iron-sulfur cluster assembly accessory protein
MDNTINETEDIVLEKNGAKVVVDKLSAPFLEGSIIDYKDNMIRSSFTVAENPKAEMSCSCGSSFTPKLNKKI